MFALLADVFKLRIGVLIAVTALAGYAVTPGLELNLWQILALGMCVFLSSASAGAFNQFVERDLDARMKRTRKRAFVTGVLPSSGLWMAIILVLLAVSVGSAAWLFNPWTALHVFLGAFTYGVVYTVWLKRRSVWNIVVGGLAGSFAVLAGAAAADPGLNQLSVLLAAVLFLWTPPHFWSLAIALRDDYAAAGVPMLPVVVGDARAARIVLANTVLLVLVSLLPAFFGLGWIYLLCAVLGGAVFIHRNIALVRNPTRKTAIGNFLASMLQLSLVLGGAMLDVWRLGL